MKMLRDSSLSAGIHPMMFYGTGKSRAFSVDIFASSSKDVVLINEYKLYHAHAKINSSISISIIYVSIRALLLSRAFLLTVGLLCAVVHHQHLLLLLR